MHWTGILQILIAIFTQKSRMLMLIFTQKLQTLTLTFAQKSVQSRKSLTATRTDTVISEINLKVANIEESKEFISKKYD